MDYKSTRKESYMDLQLDVKGCKNVYDSFVKYTEVEKLDGQNQYKAEGHGLQVVPSAHFHYLAVCSVCCCPWDSVHLAMLINLLKHVLMLQCSTLAIVHDTFPCRALPKLHNVWPAYA